MLDKTGRLLEIGQDVKVPAQKDGKNKYNGFVGFVDAILEDRGTAIIKDRDKEYFEIEVDKLVIKY